MVTPHWREICKIWKLKEKNMPQDVCTRWNSTYDMLEFAIKYRKVIDNLTSDCELGLWSYEMDSDEWVIVKQLRDILKVIEAISLQLPFNANHTCSLRRYAKMLQISSLKGRNPAFPWSSPVWINSTSILQQQWSHLNIRQQSALHLALGSRRSIDIIQRLTNRIYTTLLWVCTLSFLTDFMT